MRNPQILLTGPPRTGETTVAVRLAGLLAAAGNPALTDALKARPYVETITVTTANRDTLPEALSRRLRRS